MSIIQPELYEQNIYGDLAPSRKKDPATSKEAAKAYTAKGKLSGHAEIVLAILKRAGKPLTYRELWAHANDAERAELREPVQVMRRLDTLHKAGLVRPGAQRICGESRNQAREWSVV